MRERLGEEPKTEIAELVFKPALYRDFRYGFNYMIQINEAHVVMLTNTNIISRDVSRKLLTELELLKEQQLNEDDLDPNLEDLHFNIENWLIQKLGPEIGGRLHTARSRNDLHATLDRMVVREKILNILDLVYKLRGQLLEIAYEHIKTVMTGYTHMQPAQPITFGHYMSAIAFALERDSKRLEAAYKTLNQSPLGACALAGTDFPIDRCITAEYLGFRAILENSLDAVASRDWVPEILSALSIMMTNISRLFTDLYIWYTDEFSYIDIENSAAAVSSIMPQKKNPIIFEHCKAKAAHVFGSLISSLSALKNTPFGHSRDIAAESVLPIWNGVSEVELTLRLAMTALSSITIRKEVAFKRTRFNFCTATRLANSLVRDYNLPFREAHAIVATLVARAYKDSLKADEITPDLLDEVAIKFIGHGLRIDTFTLASILDPNKGVEALSSLGGPAPKEVERMITEARKRLEESCDILERESDAIKQAAVNLQRQVEKIINS